MSLLRSRTRNRKCIVFLSPTFSCSSITTAPHQMTSLKPKVLHTCHPIGFHFSNQAMNHRWMFFFCLNVCTSVATPDTSSAHLTEFTTHAQHHKNSDLMSHDTHVETEISSHTSGNMKGWIPGGDSVTAYSH